MLEFFKKKPKIEKKPLADQTIDTSEIDRLLDSPRFEIYKPYMEANKEQCALQLKISKSTKSITDKIQHMYRSDIIYSLIHNIDEYCHLFGYPIMAWGDFEIFLLDLLARESHITEYSICINDKDLVEEMKHEISDTIFNMFSSVRNSYFGTTDKVIMGVMNRLM